jgi:hypothetical protein
MVTDWAAVSRIGHTHDLREFIDAGKMIARITQMIKRPAADNHSRGSFASPRRVPFTVSLALVGYGSFIDLERLGA